MLDILNVDNNAKDSIGQLRRKLKGHITDLRRGEKLKDHMNKNVLPGKVIKKNMLKNSIR
jgi:hypothetical protein